MLALQDLEDWAAEHAEPAVEVAPQHVPQAQEVETVVGLQLETPVSLERRALQVVVSGITVESVCGLWASADRYMQGSVRNTIATACMTFALASSERFASVQTTAGWKLLPEVHRDTLTTLRKATSIYPSSQCDTLSEFVGAVKQALTELKDRHAEAEERQRAEEEREAGQTNIDSHAYVREALKVGRRNIARIEDFLVLANSVEHTSLLSRAIRDYVRR